MHPADNARNGHHRRQLNQPAALEEQLTALPTDEPLPNDRVSDDGPPDATLGEHPESATAVGSANLSDRFGGEAHREFLTVLRSMASSLQRIADRLDPPPSEIVGTPYVARLLGQTTTWVAEMVRNGVLPGSCIVPGTGNGKPWKFYRARVEAWLKTR